jgi:hypothetical protein
MDSRSNQNMLTGPLRIFLFLLDGLILVSILSHSFYRDIQLEKQYTFDLRNRVVGARMQKDGRSPYFYKWKTGEGDRYIDPKNGAQFRVSNITASPFLHDLFMSFCDFPERTISLLWLGIQYFFLMVITVLLMILTPSREKRMVTLNLAILFTCTEAWKCLIAAGQIYFLNAFLMSFLIYGLLKNKSQLNLWTSALATSFLVLIRPISVILFLPFILRWRNSYRYLVASGSVILLYLLFAVFNPKERQYWIDYRESLKENIKLHLTGNPTPQKNDPLPEFHRLEGFDLDRARKEILENPIRVYSENGNAFVLYEQVFGKRPSLGLLTTGFLFVIAALILGFLLCFRNKKVPHRQLFLFGFSLYALAEIFSPIHRHQYYTVQWLPLLLLSVLMIRKWTESAFLLILAGLALNFGSLDWIPMRHSIGEVLWILAWLLLAFRKADQEAFPSTQ